MRPFATSLQDPEPMLEDVAEGVQEFLAAKQPEAARVIGEVIGRTKEKWPNATGKLITSHAQHLRQYGPMIEDYDEPRGLTPFGIIIDRSCVLSQKLKEAALQYKYRWGEGSEVTEEEFEIVVKNDYTAITDPIGMRVAVESLHGLVSGFWGESSLATQHSIIFLAFYAENREIIDGHIYACPELAGKAVHLYGHSIATLLRGLAEPEDWKTASIDLARNMLRHGLTTLAWGGGDFRLPQHVSQITRKSGSTQNKSEDPAPKKQKTSPSKAPVRSEWKVEKSSFNSVFTKERLKEVPKGTNSQGRTAGFCLRLLCTGKCKKGEAACPFAHKTPPANSQLFTQLNDYIVNAKNNA